MKKYLLIIIVFFNVNVRAQYCLSGGPSSTADSNVEYVQLSGASGTSINFSGCPGVIGVQDLTSLSATVNVNTSYNLTVHFGTCQGNYYGVGEVFIDWDKNYVFDTYESIGTWSGTPPVAASSFPFTVPSWAQNGLTRMRIIHWEGGALPVDPCGSFTWGSVMDFSIQVGGGIDCSGYYGDSFSSPMMIPAIPYIDTNTTSICYTSLSPVYNSPDVYYHFIAPASSASVTVSLCNSSFDTYLSLLDASGNLLVFNDDFSSCGSASSLSWNTDPGDTLYAVVEGWNMESGEFIITIESEYVSISEHSKNEFNISPNPASENIIVESTLPLKNIQIINLQGSLVKKISGENLTTLVLPVEGITPGIYFIKAEAENFDYVQKLIIQ